MPTSQGHMTMRTLTSRTASPQQATSPWRSHTLTHAAWALVLLVANSLAPQAQAAPADPTERKIILDAARPYLEAITGQAVKYRVNQANVDGQWALVTGSLVAPNGKPLNWGKIPTCEGDTDKLLWLVMAKADGQWRPAQIHVCAVEPPEWTMDTAMSLWWPCGVYTGLEDVKGKSLEALCRTRLPKPPLKR